MRLTGLPGPSNVQQSIILDSEETINWVPVFVDAGTPKSSKIALYPTPGYEVYVQMGGAPIRALFYQDGRAFCVSGTFVYEVFASQTVTLRGSVAADANPATITSNGTAGDQLLIISGGFGYVYDMTANTLSSAITEPGFPENALMGDYLDSYGLVLKANSLQFSFSSLLDFTVWNALDVNLVSQSSDNLVALKVNHREIWLPGTKTTGIWNNTGDANVPLAPIAQAYIQSGCAASFSLQPIDNSLMWLGLNEQGTRVVYRANGYTPQRVSTHSIEDYLTDLPRVSDAIAWVYQDRGHTFYLLYCPSARHTLVYDVATGLWHKRAIWDRTYMRWYPDIGRCHTYGFDTHLVGDRQSGTIYSMKMPFRDQTTGNWRYGDVDLIISGGL